MKPGEIELLHLLATCAEDELDDVLASLPLEAVEAMNGLLGAREEVSMPRTPAAQASELDSAFIVRDHLWLLSDQIADAAEAVERGEDRRLIVSMPPRHGKSTLGSTHAPLWLLRKHPDWKFMLVSHSPNLAASWGREIRRIVEMNPRLGIGIARDAKAVSRWETTSGGIMRSLSVGQSPTGEGAKVLIIDDAVKDSAAAESALAREALWSWWQMDMSTRLEPPSLVIVIGTRFHESDFIGRLLSPEHSPETRHDWDVITIPAIASHNPERGEVDPLGRQPGEPLLSPLVPDDTPEKALERFASIRRTVGSYGWSALYDQRPAPAQGAVFNSDWWRYWTLNPAHVTEDGRYRLLDLDALRGGRVLTSWDATFKATDASDYVVGQRWARVKANHFLLDQVRDRMSFTRTLSEMKAFAKRGVGAEQARTHLVEDKANGPAILDSLRDEVSGLKPVNPRGSKEARAKACTPEIESGNVYLPDPRMPGYEWVRDLLDETRSFPKGSHDDQVDAMTQALDELRGGGTVAVGNPAGRSAGGGRVPIAQRQIVGSRTSAARADLARRRG